jgi:cell division protein FtsW (lipid II flippase)
MGKLSIIEKLILALVLIMLAVGYVLFYTDLPKFVIYVEEDGIVEWLTVLGLMMGCFVCIGRFFKLRRHRSTWFLIVVAVLALMLFFASGEEVSWGQRIFGIKSSEFFKERNTQGETNLHNLVVDGVKLNKVIFSFGLIAVMAIYLLIMPVLYEKNQKTRQFLDRSAVPVPRLYQIIGVGLLFVITELLHHEKRAELLEGGIALLFFLIIRYPKNPAIFNNKNTTQL